MDELTLLTDTKLNGVAASHMTIALPEKRRFERVSLESSQ